MRRSFDDPRPWGALLATVAMQVARIYADERGLDEKATREQIRAIFEEELRSADPGQMTVTRLECGGYCSDCRTQGNSPELVTR